jgi:hypothetical protein
VLVLGCFQCCWESQFGQGFVLVLGWFLNVVGHRSLSQVCVGFGLIFNVVGNHSLRNVLC